ncbi:expressed unknown protein [Seminavis robusta]|uniref:Uncharacterized protein n=1 Tax=Seminavis robusta TaxID=568900 RepID=A0A9N8D8Y1_9STRA|nr:expressed unknown protein [Seminavis robusta]|eukprot:Sro19_g013270.1 n/a (545) ;mRNA; f:25107-26741
MRFGPDDEHVSLYGKPLYQRGGQLLLKTLTGSYGYADENGHEVLAANNRNNPQRYPSLPVDRLLKAFAQEQQWCIESIRISHVQLLGTTGQFQKLASCLTQCHTLKSVIFGDSRTASLVSSGGDSSMEHSSLETTTTNNHSEEHYAWCGFDTMVGALSKAPHLQEVSLQNMPELSGQALGALCRSTSISKLQLLLSQSVLPTGSITGDYLRNMTESLQTNQTMKELRIFGVLDYDACHYLSQMLLVNRTLQKLALKIKLKPSAQTTSHIHDDNNLEECHLPLVAPSTHSPLPLLDALASPQCSLTSLEIYISGSRPDLEAYATAFTAALQVNQSLQHLNVIFYGLDTTTAIAAAATGGAGATLGGALAAMRTNELWMTRLAQTLKNGNYTLQQILINHGLLDLTDVVKFYLRLNRAGRKQICQFRSAVVDDAERDEDFVYDDRVVTSSPSSSAVTMITAPRPSEFDLWVATLARVRNDLSCIFYFLSCNPTLFCGADNNNNRTAPLGSARRVIHAGERRTSSRAVAWRNEALVEDGRPPLKKKR